MLLGICAALVALLWIPASRLQLDESIESFYAQNDPYLLAYQRSQSDFGGDEFVIVGYEADDPTSNDELEQIEEFSGKLSALPGVRAASTQDLASTLRNPRAEGLLRVLFRLPSTERALLGLSRRVLIGEDDRTVAIVLRLEGEQDTTVPRRETFRQIRVLAREHQPRAFVAGEPIQVHDMFRYVEQDGRILGLASSALLMAVILIFFRNLRWVILPILIIHVTLLWTKGLLELSGMKLSMVSSMLTSLITIIGIATVMHVTVTFRELRDHHARLPAYRITFALLAAPIFWTCLTTAIGFGALLSSSITPVRSFAVMMALGTLLVAVACLLILPGGILIGSWQVDPGQPIGEEWVVKRLRRLARWSSTRPKRILIGTVILIVVAGLGLAKLTVETDFSKNFRSSSDIVQALTFFESRLGGVGNWEIAFDVPNELDEIDLDAVRALSDDLRSLKLADGTQLTKVISLTDGLDLVPRIPDDEGRRGGLFGRLPRFKTPTLEERRELLNALQPEMETSLYNPETGRMRIVLRAREQQPAEVKLQLIDQVETVSRKYFPDAKATGLYVLLAYLISSLMADQLVSFALACLGVTICLAIAFRSLRIGLISIVPNVLPILLVVGGMGWSGLPINIGTAMIASVSMGLTVDSTIHYLTAYRRARAEGDTHLEAVEAAHGSVGLALTLANIALVVGFAVLTLSHFIPLVYFGILVSVAMVGGLLGNLIVLPVLLRGVKTETPAGEPA